MNGQKPFEEIDHTADAGLRIRGSTLAELFVHAAKGLTSLICEDPYPWDDRSRKQIEREINLSAESLTDLLHDWLSELLYLHSTRKIIFTDYILHSIEQQHINATVQGIRYTENDIQHLMEIKAVTYHQLSVEKSEDGYTAQVIFDI